MKLIINAMKKTILIISITVAVTSLLWFVGIKMAKNDTANTIDYSQKIIGRWTPVEDAQFDIEFTKYGSMVVYVVDPQQIMNTFSEKDMNIARSVMGLYESMLKKELPYSVEGCILNFKKVEENEMLQAKIKIYSEEDVDYLEIYDVTKLSGKYKRVMEE